MSSQSAGMASTNRTRAATPDVLLVIFLLGMGLRLYGLDADSLWTDEIFTAQRAQLDLPILVSRLAAGEGRGVQLPLTYAITHMSVVCFGLGEFTLRLPAMLAGSLSILLAYKAGEVLWSRRAGLVGGFLLAINAYHVQYSQEARHHALMAFLALLSLIFLVKALKRNAPWLWLGFVLSTVLGLYNHYFAFLFLPAEMALAAWLIAEHWFSLRGLRGAATDDCHLPAPTPLAQLIALSLSLVLVALSLLPWAHQTLSSVSSTPAGSGQLGWSTSNLKSSVLFLWDVLRSFSGLGGLAIVVWLGALFLGWARSSKATSVLLVVATGTLLAFRSLIDPGYPLIPKYLLFLLPLYLLLVARGLVACSDVLRTTLRRYTARDRWAQVLANVLPLVLIGALSMAPLSKYLHWDKEDWRSAAAYLNNHMPPDDIVLSDGEYYEQGRDSYRALEGLPYYFSLLGRQVTILEAQKGLSDNVRRLAGPEVGVWGVLYHEHELSNLSQLTEGVTIAEFSQVAVVGLSEPGGDTMQDTASILQALLLLQPSVVGRFDLHLALAQLYDDMGLSEEAASQATLARETAAEYERLVELDPALLSPDWGVAAYWRLGSTCGQLGMLREALAAYRQVLWIDPTLLEPNVRIGELYIQLEEPANALSAYQRAVELEPSSARVHLLLGRTYQGLGRTKEAIRAYQAALTIDPNDEWASRTVKLLSRSLGAEIPRPLLYSLGLKIALLGYDLSPGTVEAGGTLDLTLWWQALADMDEDYTAFVHLIGTDGRIWVQEDMLLLDGQRSTSTWQVGDVVRSDYRLEVPTDTPAGDYTVKMGIYFWETGERLPVWMADGRRLAGDIVEVQHIQVHESGA